MATITSGEHRITVDPTALYADLVDDLIEFYGTTVGMNYDAAEAAAERAAERIAL